MQWTKWLLIILLVLASAGCARRDWVSDLLVLTDVTGTWEGTAETKPQGQRGVERFSDITMALQQRGSKVTGELSWRLGHGRVEGVVTGEVLSFNAGIIGELTVDGDEMTGTLFDPLFATTTKVEVCTPCRLHFRRASSPAPSPSEPPARREP